MARKAGHAHSLPERAELKSNQKSSYKKRRGREDVDGFKPFVPENAEIPEFTFTPILIGALLGIIFGASSLYLTLKVGMTVSASIPISVLSITLFRWMSRVFKIRRATILENNIVQTTGSAGESIAFGVAVTMPALLILGFEMDLTRVMLVSVLGSVLGILMMIPLRDALIVRNHDELKFPEGTACAEVLKAGELGGANAKTVFGGFFVGFVYQFLCKGMKLWSDAVEKALLWYRGSSVALEVAPELLGVGFIIGPRVACITVAGSLLSTWVLAPMIKLFGENLSTALFPATKPIAEMSNHEIWKSYVLYIGAGAVAAGGIISLISNLPTIYRGAAAGLQGLNFKSRKGISRTHQDIPMPVVLGGLLVLAVGIWLSPRLDMNLAGAFLIIIFGFLFVTVSARLAGEIGMSSSPISGMTVATLLFTSLIFLSLGWVEPIYRVVALSVAAIVCIASSNGGTTSQDLKTGHLLGATPRYQQYAIAIGSISSALVIGYTLKILDQGSTIYSKRAFPTGFRVDLNEQPLNETERVRKADPTYGSDQALYRVLRVPQPPVSGPLAGLNAGKYLVDESGALQYFVDPGINGILKARDDGSTVEKYEAPKARLMSFIIDGILSQRLPWGLILIGVCIALVLELCGVAALPFAVGVYLPLATTAPLFLGGAIRWLVARLRPRQNHNSSDSSEGVLFSTGLIAGGSIAGILVALATANSTIAKTLDFSRGTPWLLENQFVPLLTFGIVMFLLLKTAYKGEKKA